MAEAPVISVVAEPEVEEPEVEAEGVLVPVAITEGVPVTEGVDVALAVDEDELDELLLDEAPFEPVELEACEPVFTMTPLTVPTSLLSCDWTDQLKN